MLHHTLNMHRYKRHSSITNDRLTTNARPLVIQFTQKKQRPQASRRYTAGCLTDSSVYSNSLRNVVEQ